MEEWENEKNQSVRIAASCVSSDGCLSSLYLLIGWFCRSIPHILLFCLIATCILYGIFNVLIGPITVPLAVAVYKKKNISISILFHCLCNLFSVISFCTAIL